MLQLLRRTVTGTTAVSEPRHSSVARRLVCGSAQGEGCLIDVCEITAAGEERRTAKRLRDIAGGFWEDDELLDSRFQLLRNLADPSRRDFMLRPWRGCYWIRADFVHAVVEQNRVLFLGPFTATFTTFLEEFLGMLRDEEGYGSCGRKEQFPAFDLWALECIICANVTMLNMRFGVLRQVILDHLESITWDASESSTHQLYIFKVSLSRFIEQAKPVAESLQDALDAEAEYQQREGLQAALRSATESELGPPRPGSGSLRRGGSVLSMAEAQAADGSSVYLKGGASFESLSRLSAATSRRSIVPQFRGLEELLGTWTLSTQEIVDSAIEVRDRIEDAQRFVNHSMTVMRTNFMYGEVVATVVEIAIGFGACVAGIFGMNFGTNVEIFQKEPAYSGWFSNAIFSIVAMALFLALGSFIMLENSKRRYRHYRDQFGRNLFFKKLESEDYILELGSQVSEDGSMSKPLYDRILGDLKTPTPPVPEVVNGGEPSGRRRRWDVRRQVARAAEAVRSFSRNTSFAGELTGPPAPAQDVHLELPTPRGSETSPAARSRGSAPPRNAPPPSPLWQRLATLAVGSSRQAEVTPAPTPGEQLLSGLGHNEAAVVSVIEVNSEGDFRRHDNCRLRDLVLQLWPPLDADDRDSFDAHCRALRQLSDSNRRDFLLRPRRGSDGYIVRADVARAICEPQRVLFVGPASKSFDEFLPEFLSLIQKFTLGDEGPGDDWQFDQWCVECIICASVTMHTLKLQVMQPVVNGVLSDLALYASASSLEKLYPWKCAFTKFVEDIKPMVQCLRGVLEAHAEQQLRSEGRQRAIRKGLSEGALSSFTRKLNKHRPQEPRGPSGICTPAVAAAAEPHVPGSPQLRPEARNNVVSFRCSRDASGSICSEATSGGGPCSIEDVVEPWVQSAEEVQQDAEQVCQQIDDATRFLETSNSVLRTRMMRWELVAEVLEMSCAFGAMVGGIFGMNFQTPAFHVEGWFEAVTGLVVIFCFFILEATWLFYTATKGTYRRYCEHFGHNVFFRRLDEDEYILHLAEYLSEDGTMPKAGYEQLAKDLDTPVDLRGGSEEADAGD